MSQRVQEILEMDLAAIYIGNLNTVEKDLILPTRGTHGSTLIWETGESRFIDAEGHVYRPLHGMGNRKVTLTVTAGYEGQTAQRVFTATVLQEGRENVVREFRKVAVTAVCGQDVLLPSVVIVFLMDGRRITMPVKWDPFVPLTESGTLTVEGTVTGEERKAQAEITFVDAVGEERGPERKAEYFPLNQVRLLPGTAYHEYQQRMLEYLLRVNDDQMLYNFRVASGLDTRGAEPMTGWDADNCKLKGHTSGHYLSGLALAYAATGQEEFRRKIDHMVAGLGECQEAFDASEQYHKGFLSAYSEEQFDLLEKFTRYPEIWAPYYTLDKIMSGLYDCHLLAGNAQALNILVKLGDWVYERLSRLPQEQLNTMWSMYIAGEFGGMIGTMAKLYRLTGDDKHLAASKLFANEKLYYPMEQNCDTLEDMHANQHIPQIMGALDLYETTGESEYWRVGKNFWDIVTGQHVYCNGGVGETEMFHAAGSTCSFLTDKAAESCASYNMLRLTGQIFPYVKDGCLMDYYENTLLNHILTSCSHTADGGTTYFLPLSPGGVKEYSTTENTCCHGTGMESRFRYMENIYAYDEGYVYVNLLVDSTLTGQYAMTLQTTGEGVWQIRAHKDMDKRLKVHIPAWGREGIRVSVNGTGLEEPKVCDGYLELPTPLAEGEEVTFTLSMELHVVENNSDPAFVSLAYGPYLLAALAKQKEFLTAPALSEIGKVSGNLQFDAGNLKMIPLHRVDQEAYHVYFRR